MIKEETTLDEVYEKYADGNISPVEYEVPVKTSEEYF